MATGEGPEQVAGGARLRGLGARASSKTKCWPTPGSTSRRRPISYSTCRLKTAGTQRRRRWASTSARCPRTPDTPECRNPHDSRLRLRIAPHRRRGRPGRHGLRQPAGRRRQSRTGADFDARSRRSSMSGARRCSSWACRRTPTARRAICRTRRGFHRANSSAIDCRSIRSMNATRRSKPKRV